MRRQRIISVTGSVLLVCAFAFMSIASSSTKGNSQDNAGETTNAPGTTTSSQSDESKTATSDVSDTSGNPESSDESETSVTDTSATEGTTMSKKEFIDSCKSLDYKKIARNPNDYVGKNFSFTCYVSSARIKKGGIFSRGYKYYVTYSFDMKKAKQYVKKKWADSISDAWIYASDTDKCVWLMDYRSETDPEYVEILENDVIKVYGTFTGLVSTENSLTGAEGKQVSLDIKYVEILAE